ncbi:hypothetical protein FB45DRAFT_904373 [Roridomyces roridus]|uniref:Uncharacterized protein n=1 Tax=Roridomyces roridus TaxID=1738132 RepID=A0AAD7C560_9AGAR|nr:hypothetical protein FB45DRAFT_904373 [Roridomyces roridus]
MLSSTFLFRAWAALTTRAKRLATHPSPIKRFRVGWWSVSLASGAASSECKFYTSKPISAICFSISLFCCSVGSNHTRSFFFKPWSNARNCSRCGAAAASIMALSQSRGRETMASCSRVMRSCRC